MVTQESANRTQKSDAAKGDTAKHDGKLAGILLARASAEDVAAYDEANLARATALADAAVARHKQGESVVAVDADSGVVRHGRPVTVITVVNDNMPFLFDSILGEITEGSGEPTLVTHPVVAGAARQGRRRGDPRRRRHRPRAMAVIDRLSVIHVHIGRS